MAAVSLRPTPRRPRRESAATRFAGGEDEGSGLSDVRKPFQDAHEEQTGRREEILRASPGGCGSPLEVLSIHGCSRYETREYRARDTETVHHRRLTIMKSSRLQFLWSLVLG